MTEFELAALFAKWFFYIGVAAVMGGSFILSQLRSARVLAQAVIAYIAAGAALGLLAVTVNYLGQVGELAQDGLRGMFDEQMHGFLWSTPVGESLAWRLGGLFIVLVASRFCLSQVTRLRRVALVGLWLGILTLGASFGLIGHGAELAGWARVLIGLHLLAIGCWIGSFYPLWRLCGWHEPLLLQQVMDRFGQLGVALTAMVLLSGTVLLWMLFDAPAEFIGTDYGVAVSLKLSLVVAVLLLAALHKFVLVPNLAAAHGTVARMQLQHSVALEAIIALSILAVTSVLSSVLGPVSLA